MGFWDITAGSLMKPIMEGIYGQITANQQFKRQKQVMDLQMKNQQILNQQGLDMQKDMWQHTNYENQMKQLKAAGLNPALIYGKGGQGGVTGSQGGGSASGGSVAQAPMMDLSALNFAKVNAEIDLIKAQADNLRGKTPVPSAQEKNIIADTNLKELEGKMLKENMGTFLKTAEATLNKLVTDTQAQIANIANTTTDTQKKEQEITNLKKDLEAKEQQIALMVVEKTLKEKQVNLTEEQTKAIPVQLKQAWSKIDNEVRSLDQKDTELGQAAEKLKQGWDQLNQNQQQLLINIFEAELKKDMPSISNVLGGAMRDLIGSYLNLTGREINSPKLQK
jgi:hypothetical protein